MGYRCHLHHHKCLGIFANAFAATSTIRSDLMGMYDYVGGVHDYVGYQAPSWCRRRSWHCDNLWNDLIVVEMTNTSSLSTLNTIRRDWASYSWWWSIDANSWWRSIGLKGEVDELCRN